VSLPFSDHCDPLVESGAEFNDILLTVRQTLGRGKWDYCEVRPIRFQPGAATMMGESARYLWHTIDLRPDINTIRRNFHHSVERKIRRAEREGLVYEEGNSEVLLQQFYQLLVGTRRRQHLPPQPLKWFRSLIASFGTNLKIRVASKSGTPIASILTLSHKDTVTYKYGCSDAQYHALGGVALLFWNTIQQAKAEGYQQLDMGRSDSGNEGLCTFKEHWGGIRSDLHYWRYPNLPQSYESLAKKMIVGRIVKTLPDHLLIAMGNLLYRHIG
jgi:lipid II:glycine glycyltransferase (peptidoglycan interpeptide bridge formation enzyme)